MKPVIAAFDFDGTITIGDTLLPFLYHVTPFWKNIYYSLKLLPMAIGYKIGAVDNHDAKACALSAFLTHYPEAYLHQKAMHFAQSYLPRQVRPEALRRIYWHQQQGHQCILISAGLEIYLTPWAKTLGFNHVIATRITPSGKISGRNCFGQEKVERLLALTGPKENFILYAYGDSRGDKELLALADYAFYRQMPV